MNESQKSLRAESGDSILGYAEVRALLEKAAQNEIVIPRAARQRVWGRIERQRMGSPRRVLWASLSAAMAAAALVAVLLRPPTVKVLPTRSGPMSASVQSARKPIAEIEAPGVELSVRADEQLPLLSSLSVVKVPGAARMIVGGGTLATISHLDGNGYVLKLDGGTVLAHVLPRGGKTPFWIKTPQFTAKVVGTVLRVVVKNDGSSSIAVGHGAVEVQPEGGAPIVVRSREHFPGAGATGNTPTAEELGRMGTGDLEGVTAGDFAGRSAPVPMELPTASCASASPETSARCLMDLAGRSDPVRAESALYSAGWIYLRDLRDPERALKVWQNQRAQYPAGILRSEAQASIVDALTALGQSRSALHEIDTYLTEEPRGLAAPQMHFVRGTLLRELDGNCRRALAEFSLALKRPLQPWADRARSAEKTCRTLEE